jgi:hypothetical protein
MFKWASPALPFVPDRPYRSSQKKRFYGRSMLTPLALSAFADFDCY